MSDRFKKHYHRDYYYGPEEMTEHDDWRQDSFDPRNQKPENYGEDHASHEPFLHAADAEIHAKVTEILAQDPELDSHEIEIQVRDGEVKLVGTVPSRYMKQKVIEDAASVFGVKSVENLLQVDRPAEREAA